MFLLKGHTPKTYISRIKKEKSKHSPAVWLELRHYFLVRKRDNSSKQNLTLYSYARYDELIREHEGKVGVTYLLTIEYVQHSSPSVEQY